MPEDQRANAWPVVWKKVAQKLAEHRAAGRSHLLTEDAVRMCTVLALEEVGVRPGDLAIEVLDPALHGGKLDLVIAGDCGRTVIELKYPRGSKSGISPDTMTFGELLRDFLRVAVVHAADRWVVAVLEPGLRRYLARRSAPTWAGRHGEELILERAVLEGLPKTARDAIGTLAWPLPVRATCAFAAPIDVHLALFAYHVASPAADSVAAPLAGMQKASSPASTPGAHGGRPGTARTQVLTAIATLTARSGRREVSVQEIVDEMRQIGSRYSESTVRTMLTSHMCAQVQGPNIGKYDDVDRVGRGMYRLRATGF